MSDETFARETKSLEEAHAADVAFSRLGSGNTESGSFIDGWVASREFHTAAAEAQNAELTKAITVWVESVDHHQEVWDGDSTDEHAWRVRLNKAQMRRQLAEDGLRAVLSRQPAGGVVVGE